MSNEFAYLTEQPDGRYDIIGSTGAFAVAAKACGLTALRFRLVRVLNAEAAQLPSILAELQAAGVSVTIVGPKSRAIAAKY
jgi:hypothetical protein